jgi:subtilisin family serine protease
MVNPRFSYLFVLILLWTSEVNAQDVIFKLKQRYNLSSKATVGHIPSLNQLMSSQQLKAERIFPKHSAMRKAELDQGMVDLSGMFIVKTSGWEEANELLLKLKKDHHLEYAEIAPENQLIYQPNDTANYRQWYLASVRAFEAWDIEQGDTSVFIAITDTGSDTDHDDFIEAAYRNHNDPINGTDDDGDGFVDNYFGWDTGNNDATVDSDYGQSHGMSVAGIASSATDNITGISGCGFNTRIMTVKIDDFSGRLVGAYQGVVYAADQGAPIINCSWGSYSFSQFAQDIINYAAINRGALIICGAGNGPFNVPDPSGVESKFYPAAYENAMAVGSLIQNDTVKKSSNFGYWLDIFAPGEDMWSTNASGGYRNNGGTSMAAPVVAGAAALIKSQNPSFTAKQIEERLINSAVNVEGVNDSKYQDKMGAGKVDFYNAVANDSLPGIRMENIQYSNGRNANILPGDSILIGGEFINYLEPSDLISITIEELNGNAQPLVDQIGLSPLGTLGKTDNFQNPFIFRLDPSLGTNQELEFRLRISATNYEKIQYFSTVINSDYLNMSNDELTITVGSDASFGYTGATNLGDGVRFQGGSSIMYEGGLMMGNSSTYLLSRFRGSAGTDTDFRPLSLVREVSYTQAESASAGTFDDGNFSSNPRLQIEQTNYFYDSTYTENALLINYQINNVSGGPINGLYVGLIADWDIIDYTRNQVFYDDARKMGVSSSIDTSLVAGLMAISHPSLAKHYAIDNQDAGAGGVDLSDGFERSEKFNVLLGGRDSAGFHIPNGADILDAISMGPFNIPPDSLLSVTFAILVENELSDLQEAADSALSIYNRFPIGINEQTDLEFQYSLYPNPAEGILNIQVDANPLETIEIEVYNIQGKLVLSDRFQDGQIHQLNVQSLKSGVYLIRLLGENSLIQDKFVVSKP